MAAVSVHVPEGLDAYQAIDAGQDQINHIQYIAAMMFPPLPAGPKRADRMNAIANIDFDSAEAQKVLAFLKAHHTVVDPTLALMELFTANTAKPPASFEPGVTRVARELAEQLMDVGPPSPNASIVEKAYEKGV
jgi:hypothetical protein